VSIPYNRATTAVRTRRGRRLLAGFTLATLAVLSSVAAAGPAAAHGPTVPLGSPAWGGLPTATWPGSNYDLGNTRATTRTSIDALDVGNLAVKWRFPLTGTPTFAGLVASNPVVVNGTTYLIDLNSDVYALDSNTGKQRWSHAFDDPNVGPNGVAYGNGLIIGTTFTSVFALDARTGATVWTRSLISSDQGGVDVAPQIYGDTVVVSTAPSTWTEYVPGSMGIVYALNLRTGAVRWQFNTVKDGDLWGHPEINSGGGLWYPPAVDDQGRVFLTVGNPAPYPGTAEYPNGSSRPGPDLYTDSLVTLDARTGKLLWYQQVLPHDTRDYDLEDSPVITRVPIHGVSTEEVIAAGKSGWVHAYRASDGKPLWALSVGRHLNDTGPLPTTLTQVYPGTFGGVESPMAVSDGVLFVPWVDESAQLAADQPLQAWPDLSLGRGGLAAVNAATGKVLWRQPLPQMAFGAATVANDVVFTATYDGTIFAFDVRTGRKLWTTTTGAGINSFPAIDGDTMVIAAAAPGFVTNPKSELIAYSLRH
jgi:outer membrane protein assembly factor BamB